MLDASNVCPIECERVSFSMDISKDEYPTPNYAKLMLASKPSIIDDMLDSSIENITYETMNDCFGSVYIRFADLAVTEKIEQEAISLTGLISNIGGTVGLFIGITLMSIMEIVELGVLLAIIIHRVYVKNQRI